ncbi:MAG: FMN-binding protein [Pseudonocardiales bacterium]
MRILLAIAGTVVSLVALLSFKSHSLPAASSLGLPTASLPGTTPTAPARGTATSSAAPPDPTATATKTLAGQAIQTRYGTVQVQITVSGKQIRSASFLQLTAEDRRSQEINDQAGPILLQETLSAQSAQVDVVSGATYTSDGYLESLQSALDQAGIS